ncbi:MAG: peptide chain release factor N(5)-glutamine methyltransferase [Treponema sp.]|nr:peptide chain release factor N(5)-glutamine methyltransferase [Treponema sp.]
MTIQQAKIYGKNELAKSPTPALDTEVILQHVTGFDKTRLLLNRDSQLENEQESAFMEAIGKRKTGLPVAYITNEKEFFGRSFYVDENVLIPKPDTETLIENALEIADKIEKSKTFGSEDFMICDLCSGSGCIGITFLKEIETRAPELHKKAKITFIDISEAALKITMLNAARIFSEDEIGKARFFRSNLFENLDEKFNEKFNENIDAKPGTNSATETKFDMILTNPPYIPSNEAKDLLKDGRSEPLLALDGLSDDGLGLIRNLIPQAYARLNANGVMLMETGEYNAEEAAKLMKNESFRNVSIARDWAGMLRVVKGEK